MLKFLSFLLLQMMTTRQLYVNILVAIDFSWAKKKSNDQQHTSNHKERKEISEERGYEESDTHKT